MPKPAPAEGPFLADGAPPPGCLVCGGARPRPWFVRNGTDGRPYGLWACPDCGSSFTWERPTEAELADFYADFTVDETGRGLDAKGRYEQMLEAQRRHPNGPLDAARMAARCLAHGAPKGGRLLDIGAGSGTFALAALNAGFDVSALEPSQPDREVYALMTGREATAGMLDDAFVEANAGAFDVVLLSQVLEHLHDPGVAIGRIRGLLRPGGIAAIAVPHFRSWLSRVLGKRDILIVPPAHLNHFTTRGLCRAFERQGFTTLETSTVSRFQTERIRRRLKVPVFSHVAVAGLKVWLALADRCGGGMYLNAYFRLDAADGESPPGGAA